MKTNILFCCIILAALLHAKIANANDENCSNPPQGPGGSGTSSGHQSSDPNEMAGPVGFGDADTERYVMPGETLRYTVYFENQSTASVSAQEIWVSDTLSSALDWSTFQLGEVMFSNQIESGLNKQSSGTMEVGQNNSTLRVRIQAGIDMSTGKVSWYLRSVDPYTSDGWPSDTYAGILPPNDENDSGEGYVTYTVKVHSDASSDTIYTGSTEAGQIDATATITFDYNDPIVTDPAWWNRISSSAPEKVTTPGIANGGTVTDSGVTLSWNASGLAQSYNVYFWAEGETEPATPLATGVTSTFLTLNIDLEDGTTYHWRVDAVNANGVTVGPVWSFTVDISASEGEGTGEGEGSVEGSDEGEGVTEGEGNTEGISEGEGDAEGVIEGSAEGAFEGEGTEEGVTEGVAEGSAEGATEGEGSREGETEDDSPVGCNCIKAAPFWPPLKKYFGDIYVTVLSLIVILLRRDLKK